MRLHEAARFIAARDAQHIRSGETVGFPLEREPRGSPFQMPTRLADGLGPESDPGDGLHRRSPHPGFLPGLVPPRWPAGRPASLGCFTNASNFVFEGGVVNEPGVSKPG